MKVSLELALIISAVFIAFGMVAIAGSIAKLANSIAIGMATLQRMLSGILATASRMLLTRGGNK